jgi:hypothetical protein
MDYRDLGRILIIIIPLFVQVVICFQALLLEVKSMDRTDDYIMENVVEPLLTVQTAILTHSQVIDTLNKFINALLYCQIAF